MGLLSGFGIKYHVKRSQLRNITFFIMVHATDYRTHVIAFSRCHYSLLNKLVHCLLLPIKHFCLLSVIFRFIGAYFAFPVTLLFLVVSTNLPNTVTILLYQCWLIGMTICSVLLSPSLSITFLAILWMVCTTLRFLVGHRLLQGKR